MGERERGASAVEYALLVAGVAAGLVLIVLALSSFTQGQFKDQCSNFGTANAINATADIAARQNC